jgi:hypothetical protein
MEQMFAPTDVRPAGAAHRHTCRGMRRFGQAALRGGGHIHSSHAIAAMAVAE